MVLLTVTSNISLLECNSYVKNNFGFF
jgi:hypothetical protein